MTDLTTLAAAPEGPRFSIGTAFSLTFGVLRRNLGPMALIALIFTAVESVIDYVLSGDPTGGEGTGSSILNMITYAFITAPITYATFQDLRGHRVGSSEMFSRGFKKVGRVMGASFVFGLVLIVPVAIGFFLGASIGVSVYILGPAALIYILYIIVIWFVLIPVQVMEETSFGAGFSRALELGRGRRWSLLGLMLVYGLLIIAVIAVVVGVGALFGDAPMLVMLLTIPVFAFSSVLGAILPSVVYYLLRSEKEGVGIDDIAKVFD